MDEKINKLREQILYYNDLYWNHNKSEISDEEYDLLVMELKKLNTQDNLINNINNDLIYGKKIKHSLPMLSLNKAYTFDEIKKFINKYTRSPNEVFILSPKYDGMSVRFYSPSLLVTRGDGEFGTDISDKIHLFNIKSNSFNNFPIRGEAIFEKDYFSEYVKKNIKRDDGSEYDNPRNCISGILNWKEYDKNINLNLIFMDHNYIQYPINAYSFNEEYFNSIKNIFLNLNYPIDGIVISIADTNYAESLGYTQHHPRHSLAFKFTNISKESTLIDYTCDVGRTGKITPVGIISPITINNINIKKVTLHNIENIEVRDLHIGDKIIVERAGDVIPHIINSTPGNNRQKIIINKCPSCQSDLIRKGPDLFCKNSENCRNQIIYKILNSCKILGIDLLGPKTIAKLVDAKIIYKFTDIFNINKNLINGLERFSDISSQNIINKIQDIRNIPIDSYKILSSLNIPLVSDGVSKLILQYFNINDFIDFNNIGKLSLIKGIGDNIISEIVEWFKNKSNIEDFKYLLSILNINNLSNINNLPSFCFTGKFPEKKEYYYNLLKIKGYNIKENISNDVSYLVIYENKESTKTKKANKLNIPIITLDELINQFLKG